MIHTLDLHFQGHEHTIAAFLVETYDGPILFETGPYSTYPYLEKGLSKFGYTLYDIEHVFLSHIHLDHAGASWALAANGANIYVHPFGAPHLAAPERLMESARRIYKDQMDVLWGAMNPIEADKLIEVAHQETFQIGGLTVKAWHTPGHAVHHIAWQIKDVLLTGDVAGVKIKNGIVVPPCPPPDINLEDWTDSIQLIRDVIRPSSLYLTHYGQVTAVNAHLDELEWILRDWANWIKPHWEAGTDPATVTPLFQAYTHQQLVNAGISTTDLDRYEAANPSWMSVAGLMRYWRKKAQ